MTGVDVTNLRCDELDDPQLAHWREMQAADARLRSPYFHPRFTESVAAVRPNVHVAVLYVDGECIGFLPFERTRNGTGRPVGGRLNDYHGLVARPDVSAPIGNVLSACRLSRFGFTNVLADQPTFAGHVRTSLPAPYIDLSDGLDAYADELRDRGSKRFKRIGRKERQLAREMGPLRYEHGVTDPSVLNQLAFWKSEQYRRTGLTDVFAHGWTVALLERIHATREVDFEGRLSTLHADDRLVAIEFGMQADGVYHSWFPAYDPEFAKFSPGGVLFHDILRVSAEAGVERVDLGAGLDHGKGGYASGTIPLGSGTLFGNRLTKFVHDSASTVRNLVRRSPLGFVRHVVRPVREWIEFR